MLLRNPVNVPNLMNYGVNQWVYLLYTYKVIESVTTFDGEYGLEGLIVKNKSVAVGTVKICTK